MGGEFVRGRLLPPPTDNDSQLSLIALQTSTEVDEKTANQLPRGRFHIYLGMAKSKIIKFPIFNKALILPQHPVSPFAVYSVEAISKDVPLL